LHITRPAFIASVLFLVSGFPLIAALFDLLPLQTAAAVRRLAPLRAASAFAHAVQQPGADRGGGRPSGSHSRTISAWC
jgi:hypothetical protein